MSADAPTPAGRRASSSSSVGEFELPRSPMRRTSSSMEWPDLDLSEVPFSYLLDRMDRDREATAAFIGFLRRQAKNEEKYCAGLAKCFDDPRQKPGNNILGSLQSFGRDIMGEQTEKHILDESESTAGYLHTINSALCSYAQERSQFAKFLDSKLCATLEKHVAARTRTYDTLKRERISAARMYDDSRRRLEQARHTAAKARRDWHREEAELSALSSRGEDPTSDGYDRQLRRYKESCTRSDKASEVRDEEEKTTKEALKQVKAVYRKIARSVQSQEADRIYDILSVLSASIQLEKSTYEKRIQQLTELETKLQVLDPFSDLRLFQHNCKVNEILKKSPSQTKRDRAAEAEKKKQANLLEKQKYQAVVDKFLDAVFEWRRGGAEQASAAEAQLAREMEGDSVPDLARKCIESFESKVGRDVFIRGLNRQRGAQKDVGVYFDLLAESLEALLDACVRNMDVDNCSMVMIMSQTFFRVLPPETSDEEGDDGTAINTPTAQEYIVVDSGADNQSQADADQDTITGGSVPQADSGRPTSSPHPPKPGDKEFMQTRLQRHPIWHDLTYWEETLLRGVRAEVERNCPRNPQGKVRYMYKQILQAQLRGVVFNMAAFKVPPSITEVLIRRTAIAARMDDADTEQLLKAAAKTKDPVVRRRSSSGKSPVALVGVQSPSVTTDGARSRSSGSADGASESFDENTPGKKSGLRVDTISIGNDSPTVDDRPVEAPVEDTGPNNSKNYVGSTSGSDDDIGDDDELVVTVDVDDDDAFISTGGSSGVGLNDDLSVEDTAEEVASDVELSMWL
eukprot:INCI4279.1.p1 GENE.INCI4279.1~~INCI4279.1.p1  ORF type:complete len:799 (+),score=170.15 INCI4279.1:368-2764(+)